MATQTSCTELPSSIVSLASGPSDPWRAPPHLGIP